MERIQVALIGGDLRMKYLCEMLKKRGYLVRCYGVIEMEENESLSLEETLRNSKIVVTGIPFSDGSRLFSKIRKTDATVKHLYEAMHADQTLFGGCFSKKENFLYQKKGIRCIDFMKDETLAIHNAIATAEGAIAEAMVRKKTNLHGSECLILGYGRCGKVIANKLKGLNAKVTVCDKKEEAIAYAKAFGLAYVWTQELEQKIYRYSYIFNTIPEDIIGRKLADRMRKDVLIFDIASKSNQIETWAKERLGKNYFSCRGLPGKYAPIDSAKGLMDVIFRKGIEDGFKGN